MSVSNCTVEKRRLATTDPPMWQHLDLPLLFGDMLSLVAIIKKLTSAFTNRTVFKRLTQTGNIHLHGSYLQLIHDSFLFYTPSGYDLAVAGGDMPPLLHWAKKYFSYSLYFLGQILRAFKFWRGKKEGEWAEQWRMGLRKRVWKGRKEGKHTKSAPESCRYLYM